MDTAIIFVALIGLMVMAYRGASIILIAPVFAVVAALGSEHASLPIFSELYMTKAAEYLKNYYPIFLFGAVFARLMEKGGMAASVAGKIIEILGEKRAVLAVLLGCGALTYGGLSVFVVAFVMYPFGAVVFRRLIFQRDCCQQLSGWVSSPSQWLLCLVHHRFRILSHPPTLVLPPGLVWELVFLLL